TCKGRQPPYNKLLKFNKLYAVASAGGMVERSGFTLFLIAWSLAGNRCHIDAIFLQLPVKRGSPDTQTPCNFADLAIIMSDREPEHLLFARAKCANFTCSIDPAEQTCRSTHAWMVIDRIGPRGLLGSPRRFIPCTDLREVSRRQFAGLAEKYRAIN